MPEHTQYTEHKEKIYSFYEQERRMPSYQEIASLVGFKSKNAVAKLVEKLVEHGLVGKDHKGRLIPSQQYEEVPVLGLVQAGSPTSVDPDTLETLSLDGYLIHDRGRTFLLEVVGDSMIEAHIEEGDLVVAERRSTAKDGDIVVAEVDGEWTLKYYKKNGNKVWLEPANAKYSAIIPRQSLRIAAVVRGVVRKY